MVLIFTRSDEHSTYHATRWLDFYSIKYFLIDETTRVEVLFIDLDRMKFKLKIKDEVISSSDIKGAWFRKSKLTLFRPVLKEISNQFDVDKILNLYINLEYETLEEYLNEFFSANIKSIGSSKNLYVNKLLQLKTARKVGLNIPYTEILSDLGESKFSIEDKILLKGIYDTFIFQDRNYFGSAQVKINTMTNLKRKKSNILPSLLQEYVNKKFEIRTFFFKKKMYSMAIFSQSNTKTMIDFRRYDRKKMNRMVPFKLPDLIESKLLEFCELMDLDTGSFDFIYTTDGNFVFLEVNPIGQFGFVSECCNYNLHKEIADFFMETRE